MCAHYALMIQRQKVNTVNYYVPRKKKLLKSFDKTAILIRDYVVSKYVQEPGLWRTDVTDAISDSEMAHKQRSPKNSRRAGNNRKAIK